MMKEKETTDRSGEKKTRRNVENHMIGEETTDRLSEKKSQGK